MFDNNRRKVSELELINYFKKNFSRKNRQILKGIGDDASVIKINKDKYLLATSDMLIEGKHFRSTDSLCDIGYKAIACSLSDIAAMAGSPSFALVSLGLPSRFKFQDVKLLYKGIKRAVDKSSVDIIGGDTNASDKLIIDISMLGFVSSKKITFRDSAKAGDYIFVTGGLGGSIYGKHLKFIPRVKEAEFLTNRLRINSMIDISDGLVIDLYRVLKASNAGAVIFENLLPWYKDAKNLEEVLYMGEDFELLFTAPEKGANILIKLIQQDKINFPVSFIGKIIKGQPEISLVDNMRRLKKLKPKGYLHF